MCAANLSDNTDHWVSAELRDYVELLDDYSKMFTKEFVIIVTTAVVISLEFVDGGILLENPKLSSSPGVEEHGEFIQN